MELSCGGGFSRLTNMARLSPKQKKLCMAGVCEKESSKAEGEWSCLWERLPLPLLQNILARLPIPRWQAFARCGRVVEGWDEAVCKKPCFIIAKDDRVRKFYTSDGEVEDEDEDDEEEDEDDDDEDEEDEEEDDDESEDEDDDGENEKEESMLKQGASFHSEEGQEGPDSAEEQDFFSKRVSERVGPHELTCYDSEKCCDMFVPGLVKESTDPTNIVSDAGLFCFEGYVMNPITLIHRKLPGIPGVTDYFYVHILGLTVDRKTNEFRVLAQTRLRDASDLDDFRECCPELEPVKMHVYNSVKNLWYKPRILPWTDRADLMEKLYSVVHANGCFHFLASEELFSYNIDRNFWVKIEIRDSPRTLEDVDHKDRWESLVQWQNRIFFIRTIRHRDDHQVEDKCYGFHFGGFFDVPEDNHIHTDLGIWEINPVSGQCVIFDTMPNDLRDEIFPFSDKNEALRSRYGVSYNTMMILLTRCPKYSPSKTTVKFKEVLYHFETRTWSKALGYRHTGRELKARDFPPCIGFEPRLR